LLDSWGSPQYVIDGSALRSRIAAVRRELESPNVGLYYSIKANPSISVLRCCLAAGVGLDACSLGDVELAFTAGALPQQLSYTGVGLTEAQIAWLVAHGIHLNLDSAEEVERFVEVARGQTVGLRVIPDIEAGFHPHCRSGAWGGKFGVPIEEVSVLCEAIESADCTLTTLHTHLGSSIASSLPFVRALEILLEIALDLPTVSRVNLGGGLAARYHPDDAPFPLNELRQGAIERLARFQRVTGRRIHLVFEPGELWVSEVEYLLCRVIVTKEWVRAGETVRVAITDASMNLLPAHSLYGSYYHIYVDGKPEGSTGTVEYDVYGCTNQTGDRLASRRLLPPLSPGDALVIRNAGAYAYSRSTQFNERPRPAEVWAESGSAAVSRAAETVETLTRGQV
jgi:diaminopimelate decarboxylase